MSFSDYTPIFLRIREASVSMVMALSECVNRVLLCTGSIRL